MLRDPLPYELFKRNINIYTQLISYHLFRANSRLALSHWETSLQSNDVSHWLGTNLESALSLDSEMTCDICHLFSRKATTWLSHFINSITPDGLVTQGARASGAMTLSRDILYFVNFLFSLYFSLGNLVKTDLCMETLSDMETLSTLLPFCEEEFTSG